MLIIKNYIHVIYKLYTYSPIRCPFQQTAVSCVSAKLSSEHKASAKFAKNPLACVDSKACKNELNNGECSFDDLKQIWNQINTK